MGRPRKQPVIHEVEAPEVAISISDPEPEPVILQAPVLLKSIEYEVAPGRAIVTKRGIVAAGTPVTVDMVAGGARSIASLIIRGLVVEK